MISPPEVGRAAPDQSGGQEAGHGRGGPAHPEPRLWRLGRLGLPSHSGAWELQVLSRSQPWGKRGEPLRRKPRAPPWLHPGSLSSARPMFPRPHLSPRPLSAARPGRLLCREAQTAVRPPLFHWEEHTVEGHCLNRFVVLSFWASQPQWVYMEKELLQSCRQTRRTYRLPSLQHPSPSLSPITMRLRYIAFPFPTACYRVAVSPALRGNGGEVFFTEE